MLQMTYYTLYHKISDANSVLASFRRLIAWKCNYSNVSQLWSQITNENSW